MKRMLSSLKLFSFLCRILSFLFVIDVCQERVYLYYILSIIAFVFSILLLIFGTLVLSGFLLIYVGEKTNKDNLEVSL